MPIIIAGRFKVDVTVTASASPYGLMGNVVPTTTLAGPCDWWQGGAKSDEVYEFNRAADALLAAAGVPEQNRPHPNLWQCQGTEREIQKRLLLDRFPALDVMPRRFFV